MRVLNKCAVIAVAAGLGLGAVSSAVNADEGNKDPAHEYRHAVMEAVAWNAGYFFDLLKGITTYDEAQAKMRADNLKALSTMPWEAFANRPAADLMGDALPAVWDNPEDFQTKADEFIAAVSNLASVAETGEGAVKAAAAQMGGTCKGCHDDYQKEH